MSSKIHSADEDVIHASKIVPTDFLRQYGHGIILERGLSALRAFMKRNRRLVVLEATRRWKGTTRDAIAAEQKRKFAQYKRWNKMRRLYVLLRGTLHYRLGYVVRRWFGIVEHDRGVERDAAARVLQAYTCKAMARLRAMRWSKQLWYLLKRHRNREAVARIQRYWRRHRANWKRKRYIAARRLQCAQRSRISRKKLAWCRRRRAATTLQCAFRSAIAREVTKTRLAVARAIFEKRRGAATTLQTWTRSLRARHLLATMKEDRDRSLLEAILRAIEKAERQVAACKIKKAWQTAVARREASAEIRKMIELVEKARQLAATLRVQRCFRRRRVAIMIEEMVRRLRLLQISAAVVIQKIARGNEARAIAFTMRAKRDAAVIIQSHVRGIRDRRRVRALRTFAGRATRLFREGWRRYKFRRLRKRVLYRWRRKRRLMLRPTLLAWRARTDAILTIRREKIKAAMRMWRCQLEGKVWHQWRSSTVAIRKLRRAAAHWTRRNVLMCVKRWNAGARLMQNRRDARAHRALCLVERHITRESGNVTRHQHPQRRAKYESAKKKWPKDKLAYVTWSNENVDLPVVCDEFWREQRKSQCFRQLTRNLRSRKKNEAVADLQFLRSRRVFLGWRFFRLRLYRDYRQRKRKAIEMSVGVVMRRNFVRWQRYVRKCEEERRKMRRALALVTTHAHRRSMLRWCAWRNQCRRVRRRACEWRAKSLKCAIRAWKCGSELTKQEAEATACSFWTTRARRRAIEYLRVRRKDAIEWRNIEARAKRQMRLYRMSQVTRQWKKAKRWFLIDRKGDAWCTKIQAMYRRRYNRRFVDAAIRRRDRNFYKEATLCNKVVSIDQDDIPSPVALLKNIIAEREWVFVMIWSPWSLGARKSCRQSEEFSAAAVQNCARGYEFKQWNKDIRFVRVNGCVTQPAVCSVCFEPAVKSRPLRRHVLPFEPDAVEVCKPCWCRSLGMRMPLSPVASAVAERGARVRDDNKKNDSTLLPSHWEEFVDDESGYPYYYNHVTQETTWNRPFAGIEDATKSLDKGDGDNDSDEQEEIGSFENGLVVEDGDTVALGSLFVPPVAQFPSFRLYWRGFGWSRKPGSVWRRICTPLRLTEEERESRTVVTAARITSFLDAVRDSLQTTVSNDAARLLQRMIRGTCGRSRARRVRAEKRRKEREIKEADAEKERLRKEMEKLNAPKWIESWEPASSSNGDMAPSAKAGRYCWIHRITGDVVYENPYRETPPTPRGPSKTCHACTDTSATATIVDIFRDPQKLPDAFLCLQCCKSTTDCKLATWLCYDCNKTYCSECMGKTHATGKHADHVSGHVQLSAAADGDMICSHCDVRKIERVCSSCNDHFCELCFIRKHSQGKKATHEWLPVDRPPRNPHVKRAERKLMLSASAVLNDAELRRCVEAYVKEIATRHKWLTWRLLKLNEAFETNHERLVAQYRGVLKELFDEYDKNDSGTIDRAELRDMLVSELCEPIAENELDDAMSILDLDGDGDVYFEEFVEWWVVEQIEQRSSSLKLGLLRSKLRANKRMREAMNVVKSKVRGWQFRRIRVGVRVIDEVRKLNFGGKIAAIIEDGVFDVKLDSGKFMRSVSYKNLRLRKFVGGTYAYVIEMADYEQFKDKFARYSRRKYNFDMDMEQTPKEKTMEAFGRIFIPAWNSGSLDSTFYKDGYEFKFEGDWWKQQWDESKKEFTFVNETTSKMQLENPRSTNKYKTMLRRPFDKYTDVVLPDHYVHTIETVERFKSKKKKNEFDVLTGGNKVNGEGDEEDEETVIMYAFTVPAIDETVYRKRGLALHSVKQFLQSFRERNESPPPPSSAGLSEQAMSDMLRDELCEPYQPRQITNAFEALDIYGEGSVEFEPFVKWMVRESEKPYRQSATIRVRRMKLKAAKMKRHAGELAARVDPSEKIQRALGDVASTIRKKVAKVGASPEVCRLVDLGYGRKDAQSAVRSSPGDPERWLAENDVCKLSERESTLARIRKRVKMPTFMRRIVEAREARNRCRRIERMNMRREAVREKIAAKAERLESVFGDEDGVDECEALEGKVVHGCVLCECDEFLADPHNDNKCAACGHCEDEHTIEFELYFDSEDTERKNKKAKEMQTRLKRMGLA
eukprot:g182.t1